jgi:hypothetical protein
MRSTDDILAKRFDTHKGPKRSRGASNRHCSRRALGSLLAVHCFQSAIVSESVDVLIWDVLLTVPWLTTPLMFRILDDLVVKMCSAC